MDAKEIFESGDGGCDGFMLVGGKTGGCEVVVAECEACGFSALSTREHDALGIVERHQRHCPKALALEESCRRIKVHHKGDAA